MRSQIVFKLQIAVTDKMNNSIDCIAGQRPAAQ